MKGFFIQRRDGRWDFMHRSIWEGIINHIVDAGELNDNILEYLKKQNKRDEVRIYEMGFHCWKADDINYFVRYVEENKGEKEIIQCAAKSVYETAVQDDGQWICAIIENARNSKQEHIFLKFLNDELYASFGSAQKDWNVHKRIVNEVIRLAEELEEREENSESLRDLLFSRWVKKG